MTVPHLLNRNRNLRHRHEPRLLVRVHVVRAERVLAHLDVRPRLVRVVPARDVPQTVAVGDDGDARLGARAQPAADPASTLL